MVCVPIMCWKRRLISKSSIPVYDQRKEKSWMLALTADQIHISWYLFFLRGEGPNFLRCQRKIIVIQWVFCALKWDFLFFPPMLVWLSLLNFMLFFYLITCSMAELKIKFSLLSWYKMFFWYQHVLKNDIKKNLLNFTNYIKLREISVIEYNNV